MSRKTKPCLFCENPRTNKRGEHIWDDWLNREDGVRVRRPGKVIELGRDDTPIRERRSGGFDVTRDVICDRCNNGWMSEVTEDSMFILESLIRHERPMTILERGIISIAVFAFMKAAVLDRSEDRDRQPTISRLIAQRFRQSLAPGSSGPWFPDGTQVWIANYKRTRRNEGHIQVNEFKHARRFMGYDAIFITYQVDAFVFQFTYPQWRGLSNKRPPTPYIEFINDQVSLPIWPYAGTVSWPPPLQLDSTTIQDFTERFKNAWIAR